MRIGLQLPSFSWPGGSAEIAPRLTEIAQSAEAAGFASLWVMDHFFQLPDWGSLDDPMLESYTTLGYLAAATKKMRLGAMVTGVIYRFPGVLVKTASTLDVLSGGRTYLGLGAGWYRREAMGLGIPFPPLAERFARLEENRSHCHSWFSRAPVRQGVEQDFSSAGTGRSAFAVSLAGARRSSRSEPGKTGFDAASAKKTSPCAYD